MMMRIFYRNRAGKDTKIVGYTGNLSQEPANQYIAAANIDISGLSHQAVNSRGVFLNKVENGAIVPRLQADIDKDIANRDYYIDYCEEQIAVYLQGKLKETWLMFAAENLRIFMDALQAASGIADNQLSVEGQTAKATLLYIQTNVGDPSKQAMADRDAALALLDQED